MKTHQNIADMSQAADQLTALSDFLRSSVVQMTELQERLKIAEGRAQRVQELEKVASSVRARAEVEVGARQRLEHALRARESQLLQALRDIQASKSEQKKASAIHENSQRELTQARHEVSRLRTELSQFSAKLSQLESANQALADQKEYLLQELEKRRSTPNRSENTGVVPSYQEWMIANSAETKV